MSERTYIGNKIPKFQLNRKTRLVNTSLTSQAVEINNSLRCISPDSSIIAESGDIISYNKCSLQINELPSLYNGIERETRTLASTIEFVSIRRMERRRRIKSLFYKLKNKINKVIEKYRKGESSETS